MGKQSDAQARHYRENKESYRNRNSIRKQALREHVRSMKEGKPCTDCGGVFPWYVMEFDHTGNDKFASIGNMVSNLRSVAMIDTEINKCELVCSNCHAIRTYSRLKNPLVVQ
jgi:hypothetical protein